MSRANSFRWPYAIVLKYQMFVKELAWTIEPCPIAKNLIFKSKSLLLRTLLR